MDNSGYPTEAIGKNSHDYRPLGLGYANLGALLMAAGLPYDSEAGRDYAACVTAIMCGEAYLQSSKIAELCPALEPATPALAVVHDAELDTFIDDTRPPVVHDPDLIILSLTGKASESVTDALARLLRH